MLQKEFLRRLAKNNLQLSRGSTAVRAFTVATAGLPNFGQCVTAVYKIIPKGGYLTRKDIYLTKRSFSAVIDDVNDQIVVSEFPFEISTIPEAVDALKLLAADLQYTEESTVDALTSVYSLLVNNTKNCVHLGEKGGCNLIVESLRKQLTKTPEDVSSTVVCLHQIIIGMLGSDLTLRDNLNKFALNGCLSVVTSVLLREELTAEVRCAGASCQTFIQLYSKGLPGVTDVTSVVKAVIGIITTHNDHPLALKESLSALGSLLTSLQQVKNDDIRSLLMRQNLPEILLQAMEKHVESAEIVAAAMYCGQSYILSGKGNVTQLRESGLIEYQSQVLTKCGSHEQVVMYSSLFLGYLLSHRDIGAVKGFVDTLVKVGIDKQLQEIGTKLVEDSALSKNVVRVLSIVKEHTTTEGELKD